MRNSVQKRLTFYYCYLFVTHKNYLFSFEFYLIKINACNKQIHTEYEGVIYSILTILTITSIKRFLNTFALHDASN